MSSIYIPTSNTSGSVTKDYVDQSIQPLAVQLGTATSNNTPSTIVKRDVNGDFSGNKIKVSNVESTGTTLNIASDNNTSVVNIGSGAGVQAINVGNSGTGKTTIKLGGGTDEVHVNLPLRNSGGTSILNTINGNCTFGPNSMPNVTDINNTSVGTNSGSANVTGFGNTFIGYDSGKIANGVGLTLNTAIGHSSLLNMTEGRDNTAIGHATLNSLSTGIRNTAIGKAAGGVTTGTNNTFIGYSATTSVPTVINSTAIGKGALVDASHMIQLGDASVTAVKTNGVFTSGGLKLPTSGGTACTLDHYEEYTYTTKFTGPVAPTDDMTVKIVRVGKMVTLNMKTPLTFFAQTTASVYSVTQFPARFFPSTVSPTMFTIPVYYDSEVQFSPGVLKIIENTGTILINGPNDVAFFIGKTSGFGCFSVSWVL